MEDYSKNINETTVSTTTEGPETVDPKTRTTNQAPSSPQHHSAPNNLFVDCINFWGASLVSPTTTNLRIMARKGLLLAVTEPEGKNDMNRVALTLPINLKDLTKVFEKNQETMRKEFAHDPGIPFHIETIKLYQEQHLCSHLEHASLVYFDDDKPEEELVFGIIVNETTNCTILTFRGSVSKRDYQADFDVKMRKFTDDEGRTVRVQKGFSDYLFGTKAAREEAEKHHKQQQQSDQEDQGRKRSYTDGTSLFRCKYDKILSCLLEQHERYPHHELCITGHSLGGSLAILTAAALAMNPRMKLILQNVGPIRVIGFGSLLVGDLQFLRTFQRLERQKLIQSVVIMNQGDLIPLLPFSSGWKFYRAVGKRIILPNDSNHDRRPIVYSPPQPLCQCCCCKYDWISIPGFIVPRFLWILCCRRKFWNNHTVASTTNNIIGSKLYLEQLSLPSLYETDRGIYYTIPKPI